MATPVGHYLFGLSIAHAVARDEPDRRRAFWLAAIACFPDLDFIPGLLVGQPSRFHHGVSHSFAAAAGFFLLAWLFLSWGGRIPSTRAAVLCFALYASHALLDFVTRDGGAPYGIPLFWPWSHESYQSPWLLLPPVQHTNLAILGAHNLLLIAREGMIFIPLLGFVEALKRPKGASAAGPAWFFGTWFVLAVGASLVSLYQP
jgi:inner membrane protein